MPAALRAWPRKVCGRVPPCPGMQQSYGFNYYGTVGSNRDEFVIVRKMNKVDWLDDEATPKEAAE